MNTMKRLMLLVAALALALVGLMGPAVADKGGANQKGPYDATEKNQGENQGNSPNGNGTRGKADDKNPPGQVGNTHSKGYECNDNKGIGDKGGNPAHTGCQPDNPPPPGCPEGEDCDGGENCVTNCGPGGTPPGGTPPGGTPGADVPSSAPGGVATNADVPTAVDAGLTGSGENSAGGPLLFLGLGLVLAGLVLLLPKRA